jgi:hypothetical protein
MLVLRGRGGRSDKRKFGSLALQIFGVRTSHHNNNATHLITMEFHEKLKEFDPFYGSAEIVCGNRGGARCSVTRKKVDFVTA